MKKVLIAHQSSIPHYRVPFFNAVESLRPNSWGFDVVFDTSELRAPRFFKVQVDIDKFDFPILDTRTFLLPLPGNQVSYQTFFREAGNYDLLVFSSRLTNLTYSLCQLHHVTGTRLAYWGHGRDRMIPDPTGFKLLLEKLRIALAKRSDGFFAYTPSVKAYLEGKGVDGRKIFVLNNTIDISRERALFEKWYAKKHHIKEELGLQGKKTLLYVGQFNARKRIGFLLKAMSMLCDKDPDFHLLMVGSKSAPYRDNRPRNVSILGTIMDPDRMASLYVASEMYVFPGAVGLGPLQALCYDLPVLWIDAPNHTPEVEYLLPSNSIMLDNATTPQEYAQAIVDFCDDRDALTNLKEGIWQSIRHLTVEQMALNFIDGVNTILKL